MREDGGSLKERALKGAMLKPAKARVGKSWAPKEVVLKILEVDIMVPVGGHDIDLNMQRFLVNKMQACKCSIERGGVVYHLHF